MIIMDDGISLSCYEEFPEGYNGGKIPMVIIVHGFTGDITETHIVEAAKAARNCGCATLMADLYGHGRSGGAFRDHTLYKWINNLLTLIDYAREKEYVSDIYLCGHSQGGLAVMLAAAIKSDEIKGLIPLSPATIIPKNAREGRMLDTPFDADRIPHEVVLPGGQVLGENYIRVARTIDVERAIDSYDGPVLIVHGDADESVPFSEGEAAANRYAHGKLVRIPGDTHCFDFHVDHMADAIREWLSEQVTTSTSVPK